MRRLGQKIRHSWLQRIRGRNFHVVMCHDSCIHVLLNILKSIEVTGSNIIQYSLNFQGTNLRGSCFSQRRPSSWSLCSFLSWKRLYSKCEWKQRSPSLKKFNLSMLLQFEKAKNANHAYLGLKNLTIIKQFLPVLYVNSSVFSC